MAARKEILDFIMLERTETPPNSEDVQAHALRITDIYNERKADLLTLQNDLFELVASCKLYERMGLKQKHLTPDFEQAIMILIMTATDWELLLPETEIQRYENVELNVIENLAEYIRNTYSHHYRLHSTPEQTALDKLLEEWNAPGITQRVLLLLEKNGLATKNGKVYNWKIDNDNDYPNNLYVYFVYIASDKFGWRLGKNKDRIPWNKFNPLFPNMANNQNALNQYLIEIKNGIFPRRATEIDDIVK